MQFRVFIAILSLHLFVSTTNISTIDDLTNSTSSLYNRPPYGDQPSQSETKVTLPARISTTPELVQLISTISTVNALKMIVSPNGGLLILYDVLTVSYQIYDISTPVFPILLSSLLMDSSTTLKALAISSDGTTGFAIHSNVPNFGSQALNDELLIIDLSNPKSPTIIANCSITSAYSASITLSPDDKTLFAGTFSNNGTIGSTVISIFDISDLESPSNISSIYYPPQEGVSWICIALSPDGRSLFMVDGVSLHVVNVSNPRYPEQTSNVSMDDGIAVTITPDGRNVLVLAASGKDDDAVLLIGDTSNFTFAEKICPFGIYSGFDTNTFGLMALSPNNPNNLYLAGANLLMSVDISNIQHPICNPIATVIQPGLIALSPDGKTAFVSPDQITLINLYFEAQVTLDLNVLAEIPPPDQNSSLSYNSLAVSSHSNTVFLQSSNYLEIVDVANQTEPKILSIFNISDTSDDCSAVTISPNDQNAFITCMNEIMILNISNLSMPVPITAIPMVSQDNLFIISPDGQTGFLPIENGVQIINISDLTSPNNLSLYKSPDVCAPVSFTLSADARTGILVSNCLNSDYNMLEFINISNLTLPVQLNSVDIVGDTDSESDGQIFVAVTPNNQEIATVLVESPPFDFATFVAFDDTFPRELNQPTLINVSPCPLAFSSDTQTAFMPYDKALSIVDISTLTTPVVLRILPIPDLSSLQLSADESTLFLGSMNSTFTIIDLNPDYSLYLFKTTFVLGEVYPSTFMPVKLDSPGKFTKMNDQQNLSVLHISLYSIDQDQLPIYSELPSWITYDTNQGTLTFAPSAANQVGLYQIYAVFSTEIPIDVFVGIGNITNTTESMDLLVLMMSLGYISTDRFLASNFHHNKSLFLPSKYFDSQNEIHEKLLDYYIETMAKVSVSSSLYLEMVTYVFANASQAPSKLISIKTRSQSTITVTIALNTSSKGTQAQFVSNNYPVISTISDNQTTISMQGSLAVINTVLPQLIINLDAGITSCDGIFTISDGLNPILTQTVTAVSDCFVLNSAPILNSNFSINAQVSQTPIQTGEQFIIELGTMFIDLHNQALEYSLTMQDGNEDVPEWLMIRGETIIGTPPEQFSPSKIDLVVTASNQFKSTAQPFTINIRISLLYGLKLVGTYGGALITIVGLWIYIWKIYNICCKRRYRYPKDFVIKVGDKSSVESICAIAFVAEEVKMSKLILKEIVKAIAREFKVKSVCDEKILNYFVNSSSRQLEEDKLVRMIKYGMANVRNRNNGKVKNSSGTGYLRLEVVQQLIINEIVFKQLNSKQETLTKKAFEKIKNDWIHLVEISNDALEFKVNTENLEEKLQTIGLSSFKAEREIDLIDIKKTMAVTTVDKHVLNAESSGTAEISSNGESLLNPSDTGAQKEKKLSINVELLEKAIRAIAFNYHNLNVNTIDIEVIVNQKSSKISFYQRLKEFFKRDLNEIKFAKGRDAGYMVKYIVRKGVLSFYGEPDEDLKDKTLVIQIVNKRNKILRELWINCVGQGLDEEETLNTEL